MAPEEKPLLSRILPWVVLMLAALALLYFLDHGCATAKRKQNLSDQHLESIKKPDAEASVSSAQMDKTDAGDISNTGAEDSGMGRLKTVIENGSGNSNTAFILNQGKFDGKSAVLTRDSERELETLVTLLKKHTDVRIRIEAHTDNTGAADINLQLSTQQAMAVKTYLQDHGIAAERLASVGRGQTKPLHANDSEEGRSANRRIEIYLAPQ